MNSERLMLFGMQIERELKDNILQFWIDNTQDEKKGGFYGYLANDLQVEADHEKASVLNFRILWTFSAAYRLYGDEKYSAVAKRAYLYVKDHFIDREYSGVYWMLDSDGIPVDTKKQVYSIAFAIYGLSEYYRATWEKEALTLAIELFESIEKHARDAKYKGYLEALARDWSPLADMSLSPSDMNVAKSMNTHLHLLEAYTNLLRVWDSKILRTALKELHEVIIKYIIDRDKWSFKLFFDSDWTPRADITSYGHDIEGSWLMYEAAEVLGDAAILEKTGDISMRMAEKVLQEGMDKVYGGIFNEKRGSRLEENKDWWPQAEAVAGFFNAYRLSGDEKYLEAAYDVWNFIDKHIVDKKYGEWLRQVRRDGSPLIPNEKVGPWKCPYHNGRMGFEIACGVKEFIKAGKVAAHEQIF